jgi:hypothetical protein
MGSSGADRAHSVKNPLLTDIAPRSNAEMRGEAHPKMSSEKDRQQQAETNERTLREGTTIA